MKSSKDKQTTKDMVEIKAAVGEPSQIRQPRINGKPVVCECKSTMFKNTKVNNFFECMQCGYWYEVKPNTYLTKI